MRRHYQLLLHMFPKFWCATLELDCMTIGKWQQILSRVKNFSRAFEFRYLRLFSAESLFMLLCTVLYTSTFYARLQWAALWVGCMEPYLGAKKRLFPFWRALGLAPDLLLNLNPRRPPWAATNACPWVIKDHLRQSIWAPWGMPQLKNKLAM